MGQIHGISQPNAVRSLEEAKYQFDSERRSPREAAMATAKVLTLKYNSLNHLVHFLLFYVQLLTVLFIFS